MLFSTRLNERSSCYPPQPERLRVPPWSASDERREQRQLACALLRVVGFVFYGLAPEVPARADVVTGETVEALVYGVAACDLRCLPADLATVLEHVGHNLDCGTWAAALLELDRAGYAEPPAPEPTADAYPGTTAKLAVLEERARREQALFHRKDADGVSDDTRGVLVAPPMHWRSGEPNAFALPGVVIDVRQPAAPCAEEVA